MQDREKTGLEFMEGFTLLAAAIWIGGALLMLIAVVLGQGRV